MIILLPKCPKCGCMDIRSNMMGHYCFKCGYTHKAAIFSPTWEGTETYDSTTGRTNAQKTCKRNDIGALGDCGFFNGGQSCENCPEYR